MDIPYNWTVGEGKGWEGRSEAMILLTHFMTFLHHPPGILTPTVDFPPVPSALH